MATIRVDTDEQAPTHHVKLSDGVNDVGLILCNARGDADVTSIAYGGYPTSSTKISQGQTGYDDMQMPFSPITQDDWSGGRGHLWLDENGSAYFDGYCADTNKAGRIIPGGAEHFVDGFLSGSEDMRWPRESSGGSMAYDWVEMTGTKYIAIPFTASGTYTMAFVQVMLKYIDTAGADLLVGIWTDSAGSPGSIHSEITISATGKDITDDHYINKEEVAITGGLTSGTDYWFMVRCNNQSGSTYVLTDYRASTTAKTSTNGSDWSATTSHLFFRVRANAVADRRAWFCELEGALLLVDTNGTNTYLWKIGEQGVASGGSTTTLVDAGAGWTTDEWIGAVVSIWPDTGGGHSYGAQFQPYARITSNTADTLTFTPAMNTAPLSTDRYSIIANDKISLLHTYSSQVATDALVVHRALYIAFGDDADIETVNTAVGGAPPVHSYQYVTQTGRNSFQFAYTDYGGTDILWGSDTYWVQKWANPATTGSPALGAPSSVTVGSKGEPINNIGPYGDSGLLHVIKTGSIWYIDASDQPVRVPIYELDSINDPANGKAMLQHNVYLYFSLVGGGLERYYDGQMSDMGPNRNEGMPTDRQGDISALRGYPGLLVAAIEGSATGYASVLTWNGTGWCEVYRSSNADYKITDVHLQSIPGTNVDRLWIQDGPNILWVPISVNPYNLEAQLYNFYTFAPEAYLITSKIRGSLKALKKTFVSLQLTVERNYNSVGDIYVDYRYGDGATDSDWALVDATSWKGYYQSAKKIIDTAGIKAEWIQFRLRMSPAYNRNGRLRIDHFLVDSLMKTPVAYTTGLPFRMGDNTYNLCEERDDQDAATALAQIKTWAKTPTVLTMDSVVPLLDYDDSATRVMIDPPGVRLLNRVQSEDTTTYIHEVQIVDVDLSEDVIP